MSAEIHGPGGHAEFALCGLAFDAHESGDHHEPVTLAEPGQRITCTQCCRVLADIRSSYRGQKYIGRSDTTEGIRHA